MLLNGGRAIVPNVIKAVEVARQRGILVIWVCIHFFSLFTFFCYCLLILLL